VNYALQAENILQQAGLPHKLIPVPKQISADCGVCLRFELKYRQEIETALLNKVEIKEIREMTN
jgi:hypothetical protein